jgi:hypothetical protein
MGWEWRCFSLLSTHYPGEPLPIPPTAREDVYFPASPSLGVKLRNGAGLLEVKERTEPPQKMPGLKGNAEYWSGDLVSTDAETFLRHRCPDRPTGVRVHVRKRRAHTRYGEETEAIFMAFLEGRFEPVLIERYFSVSIESDLGTISAHVADTPVPDGAIIAGYPTVVLDVARRACAASSDAPTSVGSLNVGLSSASTPADHVPQAAGFAAPAPVQPGLGGAVRSLGPMDFR